MKRVKNMQIPPTAIVFSLLITSSLTATAADGIAIVPGQYELRSDKSDKVISECYQGKRLTAAVLEKKMNGSLPEKSKCKITERASADKSMTLDIACRYGDGVIGKGQMRVNASGEQFQATSDFALTASGQTRKMQSITTARRTGDC